MEKSKLPGYRDLQIYQLSFELASQYNDLGGKINKIIQYVEKNWETPTITRNS